MSAINGDKARFNIRRKKKIQRRLDTKKMIATLAQPSKPATTKATEKSA